MNYIRPLLQAVPILLMSLIAWLIVPLALPFAKWDKAESLQNNVSAVYGDLPKWAAWFSTPDARLPGGLYEQTVLKMLNDKGRFLTSWYWLGFRNRAHGFAAMFSKPATEAQYLVPEMFGMCDYGGGLWKYRKALGPLILKAGYRIYKSVGGTFYASPCLTLQKAR